MGTTPLNVRLGRIEDVPAGEHDAVVLPANEYFDDECVRDERSALVAFVQKHFATRITELQVLIRDELQRHALPVVRQICLTAAGLLS